MQDRIIDEEKMSDEIMHLFRVNNHRGMNELFVEYVHWQANSSCASAESVVDRAHGLFDGFCVVIDIYNQLESQPQNIGIEKKLLTDKALYHASISYPHIHGSITSFYRDAVDFHPKEYSSNASGSKTDIIPNPDTLIELINKEFIHN
jgi:hypothetical protein